MKTKYKHIHFEQIEDYYKKARWSCRNNRSGDEVGSVFWYEPWRRYCFSQADEGILFDTGCLQDIINFMEQLKGGG